MQNTKPVWTFKAKAKLPIEKVEAVLFALHKGEYKSENLPFILRGKTNCSIIEENGQFTISFEDGHKEFVKIDTIKHQLTIQGEWWYKGVYTLQQQQNQTLITLDIYNVASKLRWAASLMILPEKTKHKANFEEFINDLENEANTTTR